MATQKVIPTIPESLKEHVRDNLYQFVSNLANFASETELDEAQRQYIMLLNAERDLKGIVKEKFTRLPKSPDGKSFNMEMFKKTADDNVLSRAILNQLNKGSSALKAGWDYYALKQSQTTLEVLQGKESMMETDDLDDMYGHGYEDEMEDFRNSVISSLIWMNHDYFDSKILSKAQVEDKYFKSLEREWNKQKKGELPNGTIDQFKKLPKNRPLHAVITTILEQARKTEHAAASAGEYVKLRTMEQKMPPKQIPKDIDLDERDPNCSLKKMAERYRMPSSRSFRQAAEFKLVPLEEYKQLRGTIEHQINNIIELSSRLSGITSQQIADGEIFTEIGNQNKPRRLGQRFSEVFEDTWSNAYEVLKPKRPLSKREDEKEEMDEKTIEILQNIVKVIYEFCQKVADIQDTKLISVMTPSIFDPMNTKKDAKIQEHFSKVAIEKTEKVAQDYRKAIAPATIPFLKQNILTQELQVKVLSDISIGKELKEYVDNCVDLIWYMCIQKPPMEIVWGKRGEKFNKEMFRFSGKKGTKFRLTVWPAVLYHKDGALASPGYAVPE